MLLIPNSSNIFCSDKKIIILHDLLKNIQQRWDNRKKNAKKTNILVISLILILNYTISKYWEGKWPFRKIDTNVDIERFVHIYIDMRLPRALQATWAYWTLFSRVQLLGIYIMTFPHSAVKIVGLQFCNATLYKYVQILKCNASLRFSLTKFTSRLMLY